MCLLLYKTGLSVSVDPQSIIGPKTWELNILMKDGLVASQRVSGPENISVIEEMSVVNRSMIPHWISWSKKWYFDGFVICEFLESF